jgi:hypothetical protein
MRPNVFSAQISKADETGWVDYIVRVHLKRDGTRWRTGGEVKGKLANEVGSQYPFHYLGTWCIQCSITSADANN